ncbi:MULTISPECIES: hypothetical protein [Sphingobacterium]|uniref:hypothetical protein n=1 Tax=Sphingobacterium TaxID=28453 RepID=UPI0013DA61F6|nr:MULTISPECIES: hypothetical protein [unclassified Sphingobacterium]
MSKTIKINTPSTIDFQKLYDFLWESDPSVFAIGRSPDIVYFYRDGYSTRGIDVSKEDGGYEVRLTTLANSADYKLTKSVILFFEMNPADTVIWFEDRMVESANIFSENEIDNYFKRDIELVYQLSNQHKTAITLSAANHDYYLGEYAFSKIDMQTAGWEMRTEQLIQQVLYRLPKSESDNILQIGEAEEMKIAKLVTADVSYVLKKYDALLFNKSMNSNRMHDMVFLTNDILNDNLPTSWERIDDYTILAPALGWETYLEYVCKMTPFHQPELF